MVTSVLAAFVAAAVVGAVLAVVLTRLTRAQLDRHLAAGARDAGHATTPCGASWPSSAAVSSG